MRKNIIKLIKKILHLCKYALLVLILFYIKNGLNIHLLTKLTIFKKENFSLDRSIDLQFKLNLESPFTLSHGLMLNQTKNLNIDDISMILDSAHLEQCKFIPDNLSGKVKIEEHALSEKELEFKFSNQFPASSGGHWKPNECFSRNKVAIIVPFRDRHLHLRIFLNHMHQFLQKQNVEYRIYIIEEVSLTDLLN
jgi:hypothetical protein